ncbi:MAG TPA: VIT and VWA domain-containing protein [Pyrinomonadaceae bacterium]|nr:VIT and VWA domain-containing protein [Pyrinomonadaceae bacterium]
MNREILPKSLLILVLAVVVLPVLIVYLLSPTPVFAQTNETSGSLTVFDAQGNPKSMCPLKHTEVKAEISGFISRVVVTQQFENPFKEKIEAVYAFPLPQNAAVDDMTMIVGERTVRGKILPREEARAVYEAAKSSGKVAGLLDQERPNIFTQSVANILPGEQIKITISYVEKLSYVNGAYEFVFPMVVGPRYIPGTPASNHRRGGGGGYSPDTDRVPDASRITPKPPPPGMRSGHDISLDVTLDAGLIIDNLTSKTHVVDIQRPDIRSARLHLKENSTIPNKDFILRYDVAGQAIQDAVLSHRSEKGGFFTMILQPPERVVASDVTPKELVFVLDTSGSMNGFPIEKAKETMKLALDSLYPSDTFNLITFAGDTVILFPEPVPATRENLSKAQAFLESRSGAGGTEMMTAIRAALKPSDDQSHVRIVCFMTDGYVGNDMEIISEVQKHQNARVFAFGIGSSVNRFLLDKIASAGRGEVEYVALNDDGSAAARRFHERVRNPLLTDISIDWNGLPVADVYPQRIPDLFSAKPVVVTGRFTAAGRATVRLKGKMAGQDFVREIPVELPETMASHDVLASLWARARVDNLMDQDYEGAQSGDMRADLKDTITQLGIEYRLMTQFTSFVAVEERVVTDGGQPRRIDVPVEVPEGVDRETAYEEMRPSGTLQSPTSNLLSSRVARRAMARSGVGGNTGGGSGAGVGTGVGGGTGGSAPKAPARMGTVLNGVAIGNAPPPSPTPPPDEVRQKVHPSVFAVVERLRKKEALTPADEGGFIRNGKAEVQVWVTEKSVAALAKLKELGFEVVLDDKNSKLIIGRLPIDKLEALAKLNFVKYVSPQK